MHGESVKLVLSHTHNKHAAATTELKLKQLLLFLSVIPQKGSGACNVDANFAFSSAFTSLAMGGSCVLETCLLQSDSTDSLHAYALVLFLFLMNWVWTKMHHRNYIESTETFCHRILISDRLALVQSKVLLRLATRCPFLIVYHLNH